jgi:hypothetical protein
MSKSFQCPGDFRTEISGWGLDYSIFAERADLIWTAGDENQVRLYRALHEGAIVLFRLLACEPSTGSVPVAYHIQEVGPMDCNGPFLVRLAQLRQRSKESLGRKIASNVSEDSQRVCDVQEFEEQLRREEILQ